MKIAIVGGGMAGLGAAYEFTKKGGNSITIFEKAPELGGLASGIKVGKQTLECYYHHMYPTYYDFFEVATELGIEKSIFFKRAKTGIFYNKALHPFDSGLDILLFKPLSFFEKVRVALILSVLRFFTSYKKYEKKRIVEWLPKWLGKRAYEVLWEPLLISKFGKYVNEVGMAWFWGKIRERPSKFGYFIGGFQTIIDALTRYLKANEVKINLGSAVTTITKANGIFVIESNNAKEEFDVVIIAAPPEPYLRLINKLVDKEYAEKVGCLKYVGTICSILVLKKSLIPFYWLNMNDRDSPFIGIIEHTQFVRPETYDGKHIIYLAKYLTTEDPFYKKSESEIWSAYLPYLKHVNPEFQEEWIESKYIFKAPFAQPVITAEYDKERPQFRSPVSGLWWVSMSHVYPWDRGTDHSFHEGRMLARECLKSQPL